MRQEDIWDTDAAQRYDTPGTGMFAPDVVGPAVDRLAALAGGGRALEFAIGTGRIAVPLAARGVPSPASNCPTWRAATPTGAAPGSPPTRPATCRSTGCPGSRYRPVRDGADAGDGCDRFAGPPGVRACQRRRMVPGRHALRRP